MVLEFPLMNTYEMIETDGLVLFATHGHVYNPSSPPPFVAFDVMLNGAYPHFCAAESGGIYYANRVLCRFRKGGTQNSYMTMKIGVLSFIVFLTVRRQNGCKWRKEMIDAVTRGIWRFSIYAGSSELRFSIR